MILIIMILMMSILSMIPLLAVIDEVEESDSDNFYDSKFPVNGDDINMMIFSWGYSSN